GLAINRHRFVHKTTHRFERHGRDSFVSCGGNFETVTMTLFKSTLIRAIRVFNFRRTEHSLFTTDPTIPWSCATRAVIQGAAQADEIADELASVWIDYERGGAATSQLIVGIRSD